MRRHLRLLPISSLLVLPLLLISTSSTSAVEVDLLILAGQSNMVGQANTTATQPGTDPVDAQIEFYYDVTNTAGSFNDDSGQTFGPLQPWQFNPSVTRLGPEMSLGRDLVNDAGLDLAMIKVAIGGSNIARWQPPAGIDYLSLVAAVNDGILEIQARGDTVNLLGMAWLQGESDSISTARADAYASNLDNFMNGFRQQMDLANPGLGFADLNLFLVEPADWKNGSNPGIATTANIAKVDQALIDFADNDPNAWHIPTDDFTQFGDNLIHFSATDQLTLGSRIADAVLATIPEPSALCLLGVGLLLSCQRRCRESRSSA